MYYIDSLLNKFTMYRLTLYYLIFLVGVAVILGYFGLLAVNPLDLIIYSFAAVITAACANYFFAQIFGAVTNVESVFITAFILVLIIPVSFPAGVLFIIGASGIAMASKYLLTIEKRHLFNPAAAAVAGIALLSPEHAATWWIGTPIMLPFVLVGGLLLIRKIRRETLAFSFLIVYLIAVVIGSITSTGTYTLIIPTLNLGVTHSPLFFFMFVMLTEPLTSPATEKLQSYYGYVTALLYATPQLRFFNLVFTPEQALLLGNVFSYFISPNYRLLLPLKWKKQLSPDTFEFAFNKISNIKYAAGQYMEWTLPHKNIDSRGNRRYFSISSSPTESELMVTVKFYNPSSSYKREMIGLNEGRKIIAASLAGDFVMPDNMSTPMVFIAGGVGIAPFRSMVQYIIDKKLSTNIVLFYTNRTPQDILYADIFERAKQNGVKTVYILTDAKSAPADWQGKVGYISEQMIKQEVPDYVGRIHYLSGPQMMVERFQDLLKSMGVPRNLIKTDFFPGYNEK